VVPTVLEVPSVTLDAKMESRATYDDC
jgi:hypothetical protein